MNKNKTYPTYFAFGALLVYGVLFVLPGILGIGFAFTDWTVFTPEINFIGLDNFRLIFSGEENYLQFIGNTLQFTVVTTIGKTVLGLAIALLVTEVAFMRNTHRVAMFIPSVLSTLIIGLIFRSILNPRDGLLNSFLALFGLPGQHWLTNPDIAFWSVMGVDVWRGMGYIMVIFVAGIMSIPPTYYEAAHIDGAGAWQRFFYITLPMLVPTLTVTTVLNVLYGLRVFDMIFVLTGGGPGFTTEVLYTSIFREFGFGRLAIGTALASLMFVFMVFVGFFLIRIMNKGEVTE